MFPFYPRKPKKSVDSDQPKKKKKRWSLFDLADEYNLDDEYNDDDEKFKFDDFDLEDFWAERQKDWDARKKEWEELWKDGKWPDHKPERSRESCELMIFEDKEQAKAYGKGGAWYNWKAGCETSRKFPEEVRSISIRMPVNWSEDPNTDQRGMVMEWHISEENAAGGQWKIEGSYYQPSMSPSLHWPKMWHGWLHDGYLHSDFTGFMRRRTQPFVFFTNRDTIYLPHEEYCFVHRTDDES